VEYLAGKNGDEGNRKKWDVQTALYSKKMDFCVRLMGTALNTYHTNSGE
jgi:hypothetical protein